jgi:hypothetical protein
MPYGGNRSGFAPKHSGIRALCAIFRRIFRFQALGRGASALFRQPVSEKMSFFVIFGLHPNYHHPRQMPNGRHHDAEVKRKLIGAALLEELPFEEHAGPLA